MANFLCTLFSLFLTFIRYILGRLHLDRPGPPPPAPLIRLQTSSSILAVNPLRSPDCPLISQAISDAPLCSTLFALTFAPGTDRAVLAVPATCPAEQSPSGSSTYVGLDSRTGSLRLMSRVGQAAQFELVPATGRAEAVYVRCPCQAGRYLSLKGGEAGVNAGVAGENETLFLNMVPAELEVGSGGAERGEVRRLEVRLQSLATREFLCSVPGERVGVLGKRGVSGGEGWVVEWHVGVRSVRVFDSQGLALGFGGEKGKELLTGAGILAERLDLEVGEDGWVILKSRKGFLRMMRGGILGLEQRNRPGRRERWWLRVAVPSLMQGADVRLRIRRKKRGVREIEAEVVVPCAADKAYGVLTSYESFHEFIEDAVGSRVLERKNRNEFLLEMVQRHSFLILSLHLKMVLSVRENPDVCSIRMNLVRGMGVRVYNGVWRVEEKSRGRSTIKLNLATAAAVPAPGFLLDGILSHTTAQSMRQIRDECIRRSSKRQPRSA